MTGKKKKIYLAGPMTGYPQHNFPAFDRAKERLEEMGWEPISPADMDRKIGYDPTKGDTLDGVDIHEFTMDCVRRDTEAIRNVDALALIDGWEHSTGAKAEVMLAKWCGIEVFKLTNLGLVPVGDLVVIERDKLNEEIRNQSHTSLSPY